MYTAYLLGALIIFAGEAACRGSANAREEFQQRVLLRKLQDFQRNEGTNAETVTWNEILADVLVKKLNIFSGSEELNLHSYIGTKPKSIVTKYVSDVLLIYKSIYDLYERKRNQEEILINKEGDPKDDVEVVVIRSEKCDDCDDDSDKTVDDKDDCPDGFVRNKFGDCVSESSKLILAIPGQCPHGYRRDMLGYCRIVFR